MFDFFTYLKPTQLGVQHPVIWPYVKRQLSLNLQRTQEFYHQHVTTVSSEHMLVRLLNSIPTPDTVSPYSFIDAIALKSSSMTATMDWMGPYHVGRVFKGVFYSGTYPEIIVSVSESFNASADEDKWWRVRAVKALRTPETALSLMLANGKNNPDKPGLAIFQVDIARLALQYRSYKKWCLANNYSGSTTQFVARFVIPNILPSQLDHAILNRLMHLYYTSQNTVDSKERVHSFVLPNVETHCNRALEAMLKNIHLAKNNFEAMLECMDLIVCDSASGLLKIPDLPLTRQVNWVLSLSRIDHLHFLIDLGLKRGLTANLGDIYQMARSVKSDSVIDMMKGVLAPPIFFEEQAKFERLLDYL
jgi:hypothetical protein